MRPVFISSLLTMLSAVILTGCNATYLIPIATPSVPVSYSPGTPYLAFGDSITHGTTLSNFNLAYPALIAQDRQFDLSNLAIPGAQACDVPTAEIFAKGVSYPPSNTPLLYTLLIGTNDEDTRGSDYYYIFGLCHQAAIAWLALPSDLKVLASSSGVVTNGTGVIETTNNWNSLMTSTLNSSISIPITLASEGPIYIWPRIADNDFGTFSYAIDGTVIGVFNTTPGDAIYTSNGIRNSLGFIRIPGVSAGTHTVSFTQTSSVGTMRIVAIGSLPTTNEMLPLVLVGDPPLQLVMPDAACDTTPSQCEDYLLQIQADVAIFAGDRLNVQFVDNHPYMHATDAEMNDYLHPNPLGHSELRTAFETAIP